MKAKNLLLIAVAVLSLAGCKYDDDAIWDAVNKQEERIAALETWQKQASQEIAALKAITDESDYILSMDSIMDGTTRIGYTITFKKSGTITLMNGQKGDTPLISLQKGEDGNYYWTLNGDLMTDANGAPIRANGGEGAEGAPAPTPQLKTGSQLKALSIPGTWQTDAFYLSVDGGKTWNKVSGDKGEKGDKGDKGDTGATGAPGAPGSSGSGGGLFSGIDNSKPSVVIFTLADGRTTFTVPRYNVELVIERNGKKLEKGEIVYMGFSAPAEFNYSKLAPGSTIAVIAPTGWRATLDRDESTITVNSPSEAECNNNHELTSAETVIIVSGGNGLNAIYTIQTKAISGKVIECDAKDLTEMLDLFSNVEDLKVSGELTAEHMEKIKGLSSSLVEIDLEEATLEGGIPDEQFSHFGKLTTVKLPKDLKKIGGNAFFSCEKLTTVSNIEGVEEIGGTAFRSCKALNSAMKLEELTKIGIGAFSGCEKLPNITIGDKVTELPNGVFESCTSLQEFTVPASVKTIGGTAFNKCNGLNTITIEEGLATIIADAFRGCSALTEITLPSTLENIGKDVFYGCNNLKSLTCKSEEPPTYDLLSGPGTLGNGLNNDLKIYVPSGSVDDYKNENTIWGQYKDKIEAIQ